MKVSIIIPVYNVEKYIRKCLESVKNQTYKDIEVIIVNDGTKDNSQEIVDEFCKKDTRFRSFIKENSGLSDTRNYGIKQACGDYIIFLDSDDYWDLDLLEKLMENVNKSDMKPDMVYFPKRLVDENEKQLEIENIESINSKDGQVILKIMRNKHITFETACSYLINRKYWVENEFKFSKGRYHEDAGLMPLVLVQAKNVSVINKPFYNYVQRDNSITINSDYKKDIKKAEDVFYFYEEYKKQLSKIDITKESKELLEEYIASAAIEKTWLLKDVDFISYYKKVKEYDMLGKIKIKSIRSLAKKMYYIYMIKKKYHKEKQ